MLKNVYNILEKHYDVSEIFDRDDERNGIKKGASHGSNGETACKYGYLRYERLSKGLYRCINHTSPDIIESCKNFTTGKLDYCAMIYFDTLWKMDTVRGGFISNLINGKSEKITNNEKLNLLKEVCLNLEDNRPDEYDKEDWKMLINDIKTKTEKTLKVIDLENNFSKKLQDYIDEKLKILYSRDNMAGMLIPECLAKEVYENDGGLSLFINSGVKTVLSELKPDDREYVLEFLENEFKLSFNVLLEKIISGIQRLKSDNITDIRNILK